MPTLPAPAIVPAVAESDSVVNYTENFSAFKRLYRSSRSAGPGALSMYTSLDGNALEDRAANSRLKFGIEIEFENFSSDIGTSLHRLGMVESPRLRGYHSGAYSNSWRLEDDCSLIGGAELISPPLRNNQDSWQELNTALNIVREKGGDATNARCGGHVNIDSAPLVSSPVRVHNDNVRRLIKIAHKFEDVIYRLATNPERDRGVNSSGQQRAKVHRAYIGSSYSNPLAASYNGTPGRETWLNMDSIVSGGGRSRVEFRIFDGSTDIHTIQTRVEIASALVRAADNPDIDEALDQMPDRSLGFHRRAAWRAANEDGVRPTRLTGEAWDQDTLAIRQFVDMMFTTNAAKNRVVAMFALNDWSWRRQRRNQRR